MAVEVSPPARKSRQPLFSPVMRMELRRRFRAARAFGTLTTYLAIVSGLALVLYVGAALSSGGTSIGAGRAVGSGLFYIVTGLLVVLVCFIGPAFSVGAITSERERGTLDVLRITPLSARQIVWAKFISAFGYTLLLTLVTLPIYMLALLIGGVEFAQLIAVICVVVAAGFAFTALGVYMSAIARSQLGAVIATYAVVLLMVIGTAIFSLVSVPVMESLRTSATSSSDHTLAIVSQLVSVASLAFSPVGSLVANELNFQARGDVFTMVLDPAASSLPSGASPSALTIPAPFLMMTLIYICAGTIMLLLAANRLRRPE